MKITFVLFFCFFLVACVDEEKPVKDLTVSEKEKIIEDCNASGKSATSPYCKEVGYVYQTEQAAEVEKQVHRKNYHIAPMQDPAGFRK
jgi:hypothetical protein